MMGERKIDTIDNSKNSEAPPLDSYGEDGMADREIDEMRKNSILLRII